MNQWNEDDAQFMFKAADELASEVTKSFAAEIMSDNNSFSKRLMRSVNPGHSLTPTIKQQCISLINANLGEHYEKSFGHDWQHDKNQEMEDPGLVYLFYREQDIDGQLGEVVIFLSFMVTYNEGEKVLYLYEIHLHPLYQGMGLGSVLLDNFHQLSASLSGQLKTSATSLTVFSANERAFKWYKSTGYELTQQSPQDRKLRGKIVKPECYWLRRYNNNA